MSVEAMAWAFRQKLPPKPKIVLLALADQTDETTGRVCYGKTDIKHLAQKCSVGERSLYRYLAALIRNGYALRESGKERGHESQFWLRLDRPVSKAAEWHWKVADSVDDEGDDLDGDPQDVEGGYANLAEGETGKNPSAPDQIGGGGLPQDGRPRVSGRPNNIKARVRESEDRSFSKEAQELERESGAIRKAAAAQGVKVFVIEGTRAWHAWIEHRRKLKQIASLPICHGTGEYANRRGWWLPSLFPPQDSTGPPIQPLSDEEASDFVDL